MSNTEVLNIPEVKKALELLDETFKLRGIPYFLAAVKENKATSTEYHMQFLTPAVADVDLKDDKISKMLNVMNGFDTVPPVPMCEDIF